MEIEKPESQFEKFILEKDAVWFDKVFGLIPKPVLEGKFHDPNKSQNPEDGKGEKRKLREKNRGKRPVPLQKGTKTNKAGDKHKEPGSELQEKLRQKIKEQRDQRKADDPGLIQKRQTKKKFKIERRALKNRSAKVTRRADKKGKDAGQKDAGQKETEGGDAEPVSSGDPEPMAIETGLVTGFAKNEQNTKKKFRRKPPAKKLKELQMMLIDAEKKSGSGRKASNANGKDSDVPMSDGKDKEMEKALSRARGESVKDDVRKLKKSIKREKRKTEKSQEEWADRVDTLEKEKQAKQERRDKHLKERKENKASGKKKPKKSKK